MRTMFDSVNAAAIPAGAMMVAGYVDGPISQWTPADWQRWRSAVRVAIAVFPTTNDGMVLDVEKGDASPEQAPSWVVMRRRAGVDPTVYCSRFAWPTVRAAFAAQGVAEPHWWIADWTGTPHIPAGAVACQWQADGTYDVSAVADYWPGVDNGQTLPMFAPAGTAVLLAAHAGASAGNPAGLLALGLMVVAAVLFGGGG